MERYSSLRRIIRGRLLLDEPLHRHTSFAIGGPAEAMVFPADDEELISVLVFARDEDIPLLVLGNGTNVLVSDAGFPGMVIRLADGFSDIQRHGETVIVGAGVELEEMVKFCLHHRLAGMEFSAGIPGTVGGAVWVNAGAQRTDMSHIVQEVQGVNRNGVTVNLHRCSIPFAYRKSGLPRDLVLTQVRLSLADEDERVIEEKMRANLAKRKARHPLSEPSAGCIFKNPPEGVAGKLIEATGGKGMRVGGAQVSTKHANFIINRGGATAADVLALIEMIQRKVLRQTGILLELEIEVIGEG